MAGAGSAWIKPKKRTGLRPDALDLAEHPRFVRGGQRYAPLRRGNAGALTITKLLADGEHCQARRETEQRTLVRVKLSSLLATGPDGGGRYYRFLGFAPRRYATVAQVIEVDEPWARVICPEWHPTLLITVRAAALEPAVRAPGSWVACTANLGGPTPAAVELERITAVPASFDPGRYPTPRPPERPAAPSPGPPPAAGAGCGDVVVFLAAHEADPAATADAIYLTGHPPPVRVGGRVYVATAGNVRGWRAAAGSIPQPNGTRLRLRGPWHPVTVDAAPTEQAEGVQGGALGRQRWDWRSWPREHERR